VPSASIRKDSQWQRTRFASGTIRTLRLLPASTPRRFPTARRFGPSSAPGALLKSMASLPLPAFPPKADIESWAVDHGYSWQTTLSCVRWGQKNGEDDPLTGFRALHVHRTVVSDSISTLSPRSSNFDRKVF